ncbi:MAG: FecR domain-containing protein [Colwellia sp.]|nr:FecR domain-containing protein [Colwellia sp.]
MNISPNVKIVLSTLLFLFYTPHSLAELKAGKTMIATGKVEALSTDNQEKRPLKRRSTVFTNDIVTTGAASKTQLRMIDGSIIALKENTELIISQYKFNSGDEKNSAVLDLVKGGLRSITGAIKADSGQYQLKTPVGSIGIRGTHYQVEVINAMVWFAVWDGAIDVLINIGGQTGETLSLGKGESFSYASIDNSGVITSYVEPPEIFNKGMSTKITEISKFLNTDNAITPAIGNIPLTRLEINTALIITALEQNSTEFVRYDELNSLEPENIYELVAAKQGVIEYANAAVTSTYSLSNFSAGMTIDFESGRIFNGQLSFNDDRDADLWNAAFSGNMNITDENVFLDVDITFASHGNNLVEGNITAGFVDFLGLDAVSGTFELYEENDRASDRLSVDGSFQVKP